MAGLPELFLEQPGQAISLDVSTMGLHVPSLHALDWKRVFGEMRALESGAVANVDEDRQVGHYWLRAPERAPTMAYASAIGEAVEEVVGFVRGVRSGAITAPDGSRFTDVLHIGTGGSALGPGFLVDACGTDEGLTVQFLDNTDPDGIHRILRGIGDRLRTTLLVMVSKSGSTPEPNNALAIVHDQLALRGLPIGPVSVAVTVEGSSLSKRAKEEGWLRSFPVWQWVGGRVSSMSAAGLLPAGLAGAEIGGLLSGAAQMDEWTRTEDVLRNPAALLAGAWYLAGNGKGDRCGVTIPYADRYVLLSRHLQQVIMESIGQRLDRDGNEVRQGLTVYGNKGSTDQHAFVQQLRDGRDDFFVMFVQVLDIGLTGDVEIQPGITTGDYLQGFLLGTRRALIDEGRPVMTLTVPTVDARCTGALIALFERAVSFYGTLININPYHQPGVEAGKKAAALALEMSTSLRGLIATDGQTVDALSEALKAPKLDVYFLLQRLEATGRVRQDRTGRDVLWVCT